MKQEQQRRDCELCESEATVFCPSDSAFLCFACDSKVHEANFLVARHVRQTICQTCSQMTETGVSGVGFRPFTAACRDCAAVEDDADSVSSDCVSTTTTKTTTTAKGSCIKGRKGCMSRPINGGYMEMEDIFVNWGRRMGIGRGDVAVRTACSGLRVCLDRWKKVLPFRICLAGSMWLGIRVGMDKSADKLAEKLKQLEEISGVPVKVIVAAELKLSRVLRAGRVEVQQRSRVEPEEGWAEC